LPDFEDDSICVIDGMAASFAGLFPAQFLSPLLIHELGNHWGPGGKLAYTETVARSGAAATVSYAFYVSVKGYTILPTVHLPLSFYDVIGDFQLIWVAYAILLGVVSGVVGFIGFLSLAVFNVLGGKVTSHLNTLGDRFGWSGGVFGKLFTPVVGGLLVGALTIAAPLNLGDGSEQLVAVLAYRNELGVGTLIVTALLKLASLGICLGFGFVGGPFFPIFFTGVCTGSIMHLLIPDIPLLIAFSCCAAGVPAALLPGMFFLTATVSTVFVLGGPATTTVFLTCIVSYNTVCGMGLVQNLLLKAARKQELEASGEVHGEQEGATSWNPLLQKAWVERPLQSLSSMVHSRTRPETEESTSIVPANAVSSIPNADETPPTSALSTHPVDP
jgi:H+/Cl- antiporter ClcA